MSKTKVSVVIPIYNVRPYLRQCIESVLAQTLQEIEIILVDDGSTDGCEKICDEYAAQDTRIRVIHKKNGGLVSARKAGSAIARGEYIACLDGDDFVEPMIYQTLYEAAVRTNAQIVQCANYFTVSEDEGREIFTVIKSPRETYGKKEIRETFYPGLFLRQTFPPSVWSKLFRRDEYVTHIAELDDDISMGEDMAFSYQMLMQCQRLTVVFPPMYNYRIRNESMSRSYRKDLYKSFMLVCDHLSRQTEQEKNPVLTEQAEQLYLFECVRCVLNELNPHSPLRGNELQLFLEQIATQFEPKQWRRFLAMEYRGKKCKLIVWLCMLRMKKTLYALVCLGRIKHMADEKI